MKNKILHIKFLLIAVILYGIGLFFDKGYWYFSFLKQYEGYDVSFAQKIYTEKETNVANLLNFISNELKTKTCKDLLAATLDESPENPLNTKTLEKNGIYILIYDSDTLIYKRNNPERYDTIVSDTLRFWTSNSISVSRTFSDNRFDRNKAEISNGVYTIQTKRCNKKMVVGLMEIAKKYTYQNSFLPYTFQPDFDIPATVTVNTFPVENAANVYNKKHQPMFSLFYNVASVYDKPFFATTIVLYILTIVFLLTFLQRTFVALKNKNEALTWLWLVMYAVILVGMRYTMDVWKYPYVFYFSELFQPEHYASGAILPSLGHFLLNSIFLFYFVAGFVRITNFKITNQTIINKPVLNAALLFVALIFLLLLFNHFNHQIVGLILNSSISFEVNKLLDLSYYSFAGFFIITFLLSSFVMIAEKLLSAFDETLSVKQLLLVLIILQIFVAAINFSNIYEINILADVIFSFIMIVLTFISLNHIRYKRYLYILIVLFNSVFVVTIIIQKSVEKEKGERKVLVKKLLQETDPVADLMLTDVDKKINDDQEIYKFLEKPVENSDSLIDYLKKAYFHGYLGKYKVNTFICGNTIDFSSNNRYNKCHEFYNEEIRKYCKPITNSKFYAYNKDNFNYIGIFDYIKSYPDSSKIISLYITLGSKLISEQMGYPDLLLDEDTDKPSLLKNYSTAVYKKGRLESKTGDFLYNLNNKAYISGDTSKYRFVDFDDYSHLIYQQNKTDLVIISKPVVKIIDCITSFSYIFVFFSVFLLILFVIINLREFTSTYYLNFERKFRYSMVAVMVLSFLFVGGGTFYYNYNTSRDKYNKQIADKIQSVLYIIENEMSYVPHLDSKWKNARYNKLEELLSRYSYSFFADINLYDSLGNLIASSRPEIFEKGLIGRQMNIEAFKQLSVNKKVQFVQDERIGELEYTSAYMPFYNIDKKLLAYLNIPYFTRPSILKNEISALVVTIVNLYVALFLLSAVIAFFMSRKLTQPLRFIEEEFKRIELGKKNELIPYHKNDEIGSLVKEHNRMVVELEHNTELLAASEREGAWREMAKQVAHEIKNPLTPMKLNIQFLLRAWRNKDRNFDERIENTSNTLVSQIDTLSNIATEFSLYAKIPLAKNDIVDISKIVEENVNLFERTDNADVTLESNAETPVIVYADKEQISRVLTNLIKNATQAMPEGRFGKIDVGIYKNETIVKISVKDNGNGIPDNIREKIFQPNFTTKSSGSGLGLAISKKIIESAKGKLYFESEVNVGTTFYIELPLYTNN